MENNHHQTQQQQYTKSIKKANKEEVKRVSQ